MSKKQLYFIVIVLIGVIGYLLFLPTEPKDKSTIKIGEPVITNTESVKEEDSEPAEIVEPEPKTAELIGTFIGFADGKDQFLGSFKYALIDDGTEIIRVDLRDLVGYDVTGLETALGIEAGQRVLVEGYLGSEGFVATDIVSNE